jgi:AcrR family transcriptional regulator
VAGLRQAKKANTAQAIVDAAMALFRGRQFSDVSVDDIAAAAGIGRRTFFRYFPTKEDLFLDWRRVDRDFVLAALRTRAPGEDDIGLVMRVIGDVQRQGVVMVRPEHQVEFHRLTHFDPRLSARSWLLMEKARGFLVEGLVGSTPAPSELLRARVLVSACIMVMDTAITTWIEGGMQEDLEAIVAVGVAHVRNGFAEDVTNPKTGLVAPVPSASA